MPPIPGVASAIRTLLQISGSEPKRAWGSVAAGAPPCPDFFMEVIRDRVDGRFHECQGAAHDDVSGQGVGDTEGHAEVHEGEGQGLGHGGLPVRCWR